MTETTHEVDRTIAVKIGPDDDLHRYFESLSPTAAAAEYDGLLEGLRRDVELYLDPSFWGTPDDVRYVLGQMADELASALVLNRVAMPKLMERYQLRDAGKADDKMS